MKKVWMILTVVFLLATPKAMALQLGSPQDPPQDVPQESAPAVELSALDVLTYALYALPRNEDGILAQKEIFNVIESLFAAKGIVADAGYGEDGSVRILFAGGDSDDKLTQAMRDITGSDVDFAEADMSENKGDAPTISTLMSTTSGSSYYRANGSRGVNPDLVFPPPVIICRPGDHNDPTVVCTNAHQHRMRQGIDICFPGFENCSYSDF